MAAELEYKDMKGQTFALNLWPFFLLNILCSHTIEGTRGGGEEEGRRRGGGEEGRRKDTVIQWLTT